MSSGLDQFGPCLNLIRLLLPVLELSLARIGTWSLGADLRRQHQLSSEVELQANQSTHLLPSRRVG